METGIIKTICPCCFNDFRVEVIFPDWNSPFMDTEAVCPCCGEKLKVTDLHEYDADGNIAI